MAGNDKGPSAAARKSVFHEVKQTLGGIFGGKLDAKHEILVQGMFSLLGAMARADGVVSTEEANFTNMLMDEIKLSTRARQLATAAFALGCKRDFDLEGEMLRLMKTYPRGSDEVSRVYMSLLRLAAADAMIRPGERRFLDKVTLGLGFEPEELEAGLQKVMH
jgi:DnaJ like chaperone protein